MSVEPMTAGEAAHEGYIDLDLVSGVTPATPGYVCYLLEGDAPFTGWGETPTEAFDDAATNCHAPECAAARMAVSDGLDSYTGG